MENLLFTGGTGFLGRTIKPILEVDYVVTTCGITPEDEIRINLAKEIPVLSKHFDVVLHAAGKAHVIPKTEDEKQLFFDVNYQGTVNLCAALEKVGVPKSLVFISTVAVYGCESGDLITEEHPLDGDSPYAKSKIMAEEFLTDWCKRHNVVLGILVKSILMAEDIAHILPLIAVKGGIYNVCDTFQPSFGQIAESVACQLGKSKPLNIPYWMAWCMAKVGDLLGSSAPINSYKLEKMVKSLTFSNEKARKELNWEPMDVLANYKI